MQIRLFHKTNSRSQRIVWLLEELQLDYELIFCDSAALNPPLQQADHPHRLGKFPTLQIHHNPSLEVITLAETAAIADYLSYLCNDLAISKLTALEVMQYYYWKNFTEATFMPDLALKQIFAAIVSKTPLPVRFVSRLFKLGFDRGYLNQSLKQHMQMIEDQLQSHAYITGDQFSLADILLWFPLQACTACNTEFKAFVHIQRYLLQLQSRPAFQRACKTGHWSTCIFESYWASANS